jgi:GNAT superfamily N-acetyltransferase
MSPADIEFQPLTPERWEDLVKLFGPNGACGGCWCMWWRLPRSDYDQMKGEVNRQAMQSIVLSGEIPGLLAYIDSQPVGWCSVAPREAFPVLDRSRILKRVDDQAVWSVVCFFVAKSFRKKGLTVRLLETAIEHARRSGAKIVEGYPHDVEGSSPDLFVFTGLMPAFRKVGFQEVARRSPKRPIMRYYIEPVKGSNKG